MQPVHPIHIAGNRFLLSSDRCIYWEEQNTLLLSDLHFGKTGHFRKSGIAVPQTIFKEDLQRFVSLLQQFKPSRAIIIGDMFHSRDNSEHALFLKWRRDFEQLHIQLVMGNHDILHANWYQEAGIDPVFTQYNEGGFSFVHDLNDLPESAPADQFYFSGHVHPCISIRGAGKQSICLPCFYFTRQFAILPAFGKFTGGYTIRPRKGDQVYAVMNANPRRGESAGVLKIY